MFCRKVFESIRRRIVAVFVVQAVLAAVAVAAPPAGGGVALDQSKLSFGNLVVGVASPAKKVNLTNGQNVPLTIASIVATGDFAQTNTCGASIAPNAKCAVSVTFKASATGARTGALVFTHSAGNSPQSVALSGTGVAPVLQSLSITPATASVPLGASKQFVASGSYDNGSTQDLTADVKWTSSATTILNIGNTAGSKGLAAALKQGASKITVTLGSVHTSANVTVTPPALASIAVAPSTPVVAIGLQKAFTATGTYTNGTQQNLTATASWSSSAAAVATISATGVAIAVAAGTTQIVAAVGGVSGGTALSVPAPLPTWFGQDVGLVTPAGSHTESNGVLTIRGAGADIWGTADAFRFVYRSLSGDGQIIARVAAIQNTNAWAKAGVMIREDLTPGSRYAALVISAASGFAFQRRAAPTGFTTYVGGAASAPTWIKLTRAGSVFAASISSDGSAWTQVGSDTIPMSATVSVGLAVTSHADGLLTTATIDQVTTTAGTVPVNLAPTVALTSPASGTNFTEPSSIGLTAAAEDVGGSVSRVDFYAGSVLIGSATGSPYQATWTNVPFGAFPLTATAIDNSGLSTTSSPVVITVNRAAAPGLLLPSSLTYQGAFRLPPPDFGTGTFAYGGTALAFNPANSSLFIVGHDWYQQVGEISVPEARAGVSLNDLATATLLQPTTELTEGHWTEVDGPSNTIKIGGLLPYQNQLYVSAYSYYDADGNQVLSHFVSGLDFSVQEDVRGPYQVGNSAGIISGYFGLVPAAWQAALGGPVLNGNCCLGIISRSSYGPAVSTIDPATIGLVIPAPATPLVGYPGIYPTLGDWNSNSPYFNGTTEVRGVVFPETANSVLFFGRHGLGTFCYGSGAECRDPADNSQGTHGYPYVYFVWVYDAADLASVAAGTRQGWEVVPYAVWTLQLPFAQGNAHLNGAAYDPVTGRIFLSQGFGDGTKPLIHVFSVQPPE